MSRILLVAGLLAAAYGTGRAPSDDVTDRQRRAIVRGTEWILRAQNRDGSWGLEARSPGDVTCTALAGLALMATGTTERNGDDPRAVEALRSAAEWMIDRARRARGDIVAGHTTLIQNKLGTRVHNFFSVVFLTQVYGSRPAWLAKEDLSELRDLIAALVDRIATTQEPDGSWHKNTFGSLKATCMAWLALRSASSAGLQIRQAAVDRTVRFIKSQYNASTRLFDRNLQGYQAIYATASSVRVLYGMGEADTPEARGAVESFLKFVRNGQMGGQFLTVEGEDYLSAALMSHALVREGGDRWNTWFEWIRDDLIKRQNADGSWVSTACITGRTFPTACALLALETPFRLLPLQDQ